MLLYEDHAYQLSKAACGQVPQHPLRNRFPTECFDQSRLVYEIQIQFAIIEWEFQAHL